MLLLASSGCGLFKWRQFAPEVILLAVGEGFLGLSSTDATLSQWQTGGWKVQLAKFGGIDAENIHQL
jgi:hypothetical protein